MPTYYTITMTVPRDSAQRAKLYGELMVIIDHGEIGEDHDFIFSVRKDYRSRITELAFEYNVNATVVAEKFRM